MDKNVSQENENIDLLSENTELLEIDSLNPEEKEKYIQIRKQVIACLKEITSNEKEFYDEDSMEEIGITSIAFIKLVVSLEEEFGLSFNDEELDYTMYPHLISVINYVYKKTKLESES